MAPDDLAYANGMLRVLVGRLVNRLGVGVGELALVLDTDWEVWLSGSVDVGDAPPVEPTDLDGVAAHMPLLNAEVTDARIDERGCLAVTFDSSSVRCKAHPLYEAWQILGPDGERIICMPGGDLAIWSARAG